MITKFKRKHLYAKYRIQYILNGETNYKIGRLKSYNNNKCIAFFVFYDSDDWFKKEGVEVFYSKVYDFIG